VSFKGVHFPKEIILMGVRWYVAYSLSTHQIYIRLQDEWRCLYRAVDKHGQTITFLLTEHRDKEAGQRFLKRAIRRNGLPETITRDGSEANEAAIKNYNTEHSPTIVIRQVKYLNSIVEQDPRAVKRVIRPTSGSNPLQRHSAR